MQVQIAIAAVSVTVGAVIAVFREDIRNLFKFDTSRDNKYLRGAWDCTWDTLVPAPRPQIQDRVNITRVRGNLVKGVGSTPTFGDWELDGRAGHLAASFSYSGKGTLEHLPGAIVLRKIANDEMSGVWAQYSESARDVVSGTTVWRRVPSP